MARTDYYDDPHAPKANRIVPAASAVVVNDEGKILLQRRSDNNLWALPGGTMEIGESIGETVIREVKEETGFDVQPAYIVGIYSDPKHIIAFTDGEVRQQFSICFACSILGGHLQVSNESYEVRFVLPQEIEQLNMHPSIHQRLKDYLAHRPQPVIR
ncbi:MAG TPA: NUDIX domain-containing protein [Ktedonobacteraceae bacterium]|nr:NUDIX domain-containing protein [Ktedonobacteraceae bacterium]